MGYEAWSDKLQAAYDGHIAKYKRGCIGCIVGALAIKDFASSIGLTLTEDQATLKKHETIITGSKVHHAAH